MAREFRGPTLWRTTPDGTTDVVTLRRGVLERYRVHEDGTATLPRKGRLIVLIRVALAVVMLVGWRNDPEARLARRLKSGAGGEHWIEIRTREPDNDA